MEFVAKEAEKGEHRPDHAGDSREFPLSQPIRTPLRFYARGSSPEALRECAFCNRLFIRRLYERRRTERRRLSRACNAVILDWRRRTIRPRAIKAASGRRQGHSDRDTADT